MAANAPASGSGDPFLAHTRLSISVFSSLQASDKAQAEVRQFESSLRHNPARIRQGQQELTQRRQRARDAEDAHRAAEQECARSLRSLFLNVSGEGGGGGGGGGGGRVTAGQGSTSGDGEHKPHASYFQYLELTEKLSELETKLTKTSDQTFHLLQAVASIHALLVRMAKLAQTAYHPGSWSGPGSSSETPLQHTTAGGPGNGGRGGVEPILALDSDEQAVDRLSKTHLGILFAAARRGTMSEHGTFQFIPYSANHPLNQQLRAGGIPLHPPPASYNHQQQQQHSSDAPDALPAIIPFDSPTPPNDTYTIARRLDRLGADMLELALALDKTQAALEHLSAHTEDDAKLLSLALESGWRTRCQLAELVQAMAALGVDEIRRELRGARVDVASGSGAPNEQHRAGAGMATGAAPAAAPAPVLTPSGMVGSHPGGSSDDEDIPDAPPTLATLQPQGVYPSYRVKPEPQD